MPTNPYRNPYISKPTPNKAPKPTSNEAPGLPVHDTYCVFTLIGEILGGLGKCIFAFFSTRRRSADRM